MNDNTLTALLVGIGAITVIGLAWAIAWGTTVTARVAIQSGYVEQSVPSMMTTQWVKP